MKIHNLKGRYQVTKPRHERTATTETFYNEPDGFVECEFVLEVDEERLVRLMGRKAALSKRGVSVLGGGAIVLKVLERKRVPSCLEDREASPGPTHVARGSRAGGLMNEQEMRTHAFARAQEKANKTGKVHEVYRHDGDWGHPHGDVVGHGGYKVVPMPLGDELRPGWVFHGLARPETEASK